MKISKQVLPLVVTLASLSVGAAIPNYPGAEPPDAQVSRDNFEPARGTDSIPPAEVYKNAPTSTDKSVRTETAANDNMPAKCNRASGLIGMTIRNQNDEHLGKVKDIVFDLQSDRVAYVVMAASGTGVLGFKEKLLAVPLNAFTTGSDQKSLVLQADKAKIETAQGIDQNNWPSASNPSWGAEPFWQKDQEKTDKPASTKSGYDKDQDQPPRPDGFPDNK